MNCQFLVNGGTSPFPQCDGTCCEGVNKKGSVVRRIYDQLRIALPTQQFRL